MPVKPIQIIAVRSFIDGLREKESFSWNNSFNFFMYVTGNNSIVEYQKINWKRVILSSISSKFLTKYIRNTEGADDC